VTLFLTLGTFYGVELLLPSYFQQLLGQTPLQSGLHVIPLFVGCMATIPIALRVAGKRGPGAVVLVGVVLFLVGMSAFAYGVSQRYAYTPVLSIGLVVMGIGMGCLAMPVFGVAVMSTLKPHQVARGSTLINVNQRMAISVGTALMSVILTGQFNRSPNITAAHQTATLQEAAAGLGAPPDPAKFPSVIFVPDFAEHLAADLSHAYTVVFVVAMCLVAFAGIPALFLPRRPAQQSE
jgi:MFS family permease